MMVVAGTVAQNVWAGEKPAAAPQAEPGAEADDTAASASESGGAAAGRPAKRRKAQAAEESPATPEKPSTWAPPAEINHFGQGGISIMPGTGYRVIVPYQDNIWCGDSSGNQGNRRVCTHLLPFFLDLKLSYGVHPRLDLIVDLRFGIQEDPATHGSHQFAVAPGVRYWLDQGVALKFYATGQAIYDHTDYIEVSKSDFALRNADGIMYDAIRNVGFFFQVGWTMGFTRWFRLELDTGLGVQVRFP
jgi:hypothetical protein